MSKRSKLILGIAVFVGVALYLLLKSASFSGHVAPKTLEGPVGVYKQ
jgi:hypothetical protein